LKVRSKKNHDAATDLEIEILGNETNLMNEGFGRRERIEVEAELSAEPLRTLLTDTVTKEKTPNRMKLWMQEKKVKTAVSKQNTVVGPYV